LLVLDRSFLDLREHRLRELDRPMQVFQVGGGAYALLRSLDMLPGNLPSLASSFVGRHDELAASAEAKRSFRMRPCPLAWPSSTASPAATS